MRISSTKMAVLNQPAKTISGDVMGYHEKIGMDQTTSD